MLQAALLGSALASTSPAAADYYEGLRAYDARNYSKAADFWGVSAKNGDAKSRFRLAQLYESGRGVAKNHVLAYFWYSLAAKADYHDAGLAAIFLKEKMTEAQVVQADKLVAAWKPATKTTVARAIAKSDPVIKTERKPESVPRRPPVRVSELGRPVLPAPKSADPGTPIQTLIAGGELRRTVVTSTGVVREDRWRFSPSGTVAGTFTAVSRGDPVYRDAQTDAGIWGVDGNNLCVTWNFWYRGRKICYRLTRDGAAWAARDVASGETFSAAISR
ncbi:MAG: tetratricopeptide repeat protein [Pseudomonadota bacterium]